MSAPVTKQTRAPKVPPVDRKYYEQKIDAIDSQINQLKSKIQGLSKQISAKSTGKDEFFRERNEAKAKVDECQARLSELDAKKSKINEGISQSLQSNKDMRQEMNTMSKKIGFQSEEEIDKQISEIEYQMHTETLNLKREKELMAKISQLKQVKPQLSKLHKMKTSQGTSDSVGPLKSQLADVQKEIAVAREEKQKHQAALSKITEARKKAMSGVSHIFEERDKLNEELKGLFGEIKAIKDERSTKIKAFNEYIADQKASRAERDKAEKTLRDAEKEKRRLEDELEKDVMTPFLTEIELVNNMIIYCKSLLPNADADKTDLNGSAGKPVKAIEGTTVLLNKKDREEEFFFAPEVGKKKEKKKETIADSSKPLKNSLETMHLFAQVKVDPPTSVKDVPRTLVDLDKKLAEFKNKQVKEIADRKLRRSDKEKAVIDAAKAVELAQVEAKKIAATTPHDDYDDH